MSDLDWERFIPINEIKMDEVKSIFTGFDNQMDVISFDAIKLGCKNSNFTVRTNHGKFFLRIADKSGMNNEMAAYELVKGRIHVPNLLYHTAEANADIFIYQHIDGVSLQKRIVEDNQCDPSLLVQVAKAAALIHNTPEEKTNELAKWDVPPFEMWYPAFLEHPAVRARIGAELYKRIQRLVLENQNSISEIDRFKSLIHCDFRPANMLVDEQNQVFFVDWEGAWWGHTLADIGQFFRYRTFFTESQIHLFEQTYHAYANKKLPDRWFELALFRDLINPLQLLSVDQVAPVRNTDLINVIEGILAYWGY